MKNILYSTHFWRAFCLSTLYGIIGFLSLNFNIADYGWALFVVLPTCMGLLGGFSKEPREAMIGVFSSLVLLFLILLLTSLEGFVCLLLLSPIYLSFIGIGRAMGKALRKMLNNRHTDKIKVQLLPLLLFIGVSSMETQLKNPSQQVYEVSSEIILPYSPEEVFDAIKSVDTLIAKKPFLMRLDLPVPHKCILEREEVGALRICYFKEGTIVERITEIERGKVLRMDVIDYGLSGRPWLDFEEAIYYFEPMENGGCKMTRVSTYTTELNPREYWEIFERIGIEQEHEYVFRNLQRDLLNVHGPRVDN